MNLCKHYIGEIISEEKTQTKKGTAYYKVIVLVNGRNGRKEKIVLQLLPEELKQVKEKGYYMA